MTGTQVWHGATEVVLTFAVKTDAKRQGAVFSPQDKQQLRQQFDNWLETFTWAPVGSFGSDLDQASRA